MKNEKCICLATKKKDISTVMSDDIHDAKHTTQKKKKTSEGSVPILQQTY